MWEGLLWQGGMEAGWAGRWEGLLWQGGMEVGWAGRWEGLLWRQGGYTWRRGGLTLLKVHSAITSFVDTTVCVRESHAHTGSGCVGLK